MIRDAAGDGLSPRIVWASRLILVAVLAMGWVVAVTPGTGSADWFVHADKLRHAAAFAGFTILAVFSRIRPLWLCGAMLLTYGVAIEWAQASSPGRQASWGDVLADAAGISVGFWIARRRWRLAS